MALGSPPKRAYRPSSVLNSGYPNSTARPQTPSLRRPTSSLSLRSPTPNQTRRPITPNSASTLASSQYSSSSSLNLPAKDNLYTGNIKVSVRVKPPLNASSGVSTSQDGSITTFNDTWIVDSDRQSISTKDVGEFTFDNIFHGPISNATIFESSVGELVNQVISGYNGTVFAYGMTGSGKTYSMQGSRENPGIIPLSVHAIFDLLQTPLVDPSRSYTVKVSYLEIYNEHLHDLLAPQTPSDEIKLRDDPQRGVRALGLREVTVNSPEELIEVIQNGDALRRTEGTDFNAVSSRSHAVVQIIIESSSKGRPGAANAAPRISTLYLCDLAGSERAASQTERRKEGAYINKSLLTLGTVIARLSVASTNIANGSGSSSNGHIPYRDSKLTRLLQPALSGKSLVSVLCTVDVLNLNNSVETISTLRFAARAKNILVSAKRNEEASDPNAKLVEKLLAQVDALKMENMQLRSNGVDGTSTDAMLADITGTSEITTSAGNSALMSQIAQLEAENRILNERVEHLARLCDDNRLEELIGLGIDDDVVSSPVTTAFNGTSRSSSISSISEEEHRRKENEYRSYIAHLEKQLYLQEVQKRNSVASPDLKLPFNNNQVPSSIFPPIRPVSISSASGGSTPGSGIPQHYADIIEDLKEEVEELKESNSDKDRIISTLRSINKRKENLTALSMSSPGASSASANSPSSNHSSAYSRYYFSSSLNNATAAGDISNSQTGTAVPMAITSDEVKETNVGSTTESADTTLTDAPEF
ncbi:hypothetical protein DV113_003753 [Geotrichum candidum]|uniref:Kinesin-like protein n=1 Tax=Geotrichum candidum TaxID=1173061 RepID=A0A0J9XI72_GEOCN|nr:hypothetical protein DV113_003753 [Geotrichum candidum]CDO57120.1 similar to Saccharomyces cerevisiae YGL216W KIP3 Kinesin-related motor protein involved in mitotic spindle positioning [Geotrichum candidum]